MAYKSGSKSSGSYKSTVYAHNNNSAVDTAVKVYVYNDIINDNKANNTPTSTHNTHNTYNSSANNLAWYWISLIIVGGILMLGGILTAYSYKS